MKAVLLMLLFAVPLMAQNPAEVEITAEPHHHLALQNDYVRVFKVEVGPGDQTLMHRHHHDYMFVILGPAEVENDVAGKSPVKLSLQDGETKFTEGNFAHIAKNLSGKTPFRNVTIELLQDEKARQSPLPWEEERALHVLRGGTEEVMFVKDNVRVSEVELQRSGVLARHHHKTPHLIVAVTDLTLRNDVVGKPATNIILKSGDIKWIPSAITHTLTNVGENQAKWIVLEFQ
jgi:quercetin dioxygenase-like cupin family protein